MPSTTLMEEFHLGVYAPQGLRAAACRAIRRTLDDGRFRSALRRALRSVFDRYPALRRTRITLTC